MGVWGFEEAIAHGEDDIAGLGEVAVVGNDEDGAIALVGEVAELVKELGGILKVEVTGRFIGEDDIGIIDEGAGDGDPLAFASGELVAPAVGFIGHTQFIEPMEGGLACGSGVVEAAAKHGEEEIFDGGELGEEEVELKDKAEALGADAGAPAFGGIIDALAAEENLAGIGAIEEAEEVEEGAFTATAGADDGVGAPALQFQIESAQDMDAGGSGAEMAMEGAGFEDGGGRFRVHPPVPRMTSPGSTRAARRAGMRAAMTTTRPATAAAQK